jgi:hypothetical protein
MNNTGMRDGARRMTVSAPPGREGRDETIRLTGEKLSPEAIEQYANPLIQQRVALLAKEGWKADGATDVLTLWRQGRLSCREHASFWRDTSTYSVTSVTIRLRRISTA